MRRGLWQHPNMIEFRTLAEDHPDLTHSPLAQLARTCIFGRYKEQIVNDDRLGVTIEWVCP